MIAGIDEAGRGCLSGPVVCAAVILKEGYQNDDITDSKKISKKKREILYDEIIENCIAYSIVEVDNTVIDDINILQATLKGMDKCIRELDPQPSKVLIDGNQFYKDYYLPYETVIKGDQKFKCISAASILAKVHKDRLMSKLSEQYPEYLWHKNSGYGTKEHITAIKENGLTPLHRKTFTKNMV